MKQIIDNGTISGNPYTDKNSTHSYFQVYEQEFDKISDINLLEIGVLWGGSMKVWDEHFEGNSYIQGIDMFVYTDNKTPENMMVDPDRILNGDSTNPDGWNERLNGRLFDYIIDDGDHTSISQVKTFSVFFEYLKDGGKYFIEDIASDMDLTLIKLYLESLGHNFKVYDLRDQKNRFDDIIIVVYK